MEYCPTCENAFSYMEDLAERTLEYHCTNCDIHQPLTSNCLSTKTIKKEVEKQINYENIRHDVTLPTARDTECPACNGTDISFIRNGDLSIKYICKNDDCANVFTK
jgi:Zn finger protein HypA/HybF involved in hydrogenase expression